MTATRNPAHVSAHGRAYDQAKRRGLRTVFTRETAGTHDASTGSISAPGTETLAGYAVRLEGDPERYAALSLALVGPVTLLFVPDAYGALPGVGATAMFGGELLSVADRDPIAPDGVPISATLVCTT